MKSDFHVEDGNIAIASKRRNEEESTS
jgi:hypothetical protein